MLASADVEGWVAWDEDCGDSSDEVAFSGAPPNVFKTVNQLLLQCEHRLFSL